MEEITLSPEKKRRILKTQKIFCSFTMTESWRRNYARGCKPWVRERCEGKLFIFYLTNGFKLPKKFI